MKTRILSLAIALIALFAFSSAYAQKVHFNKNDLCLDTETGLLTGKVTGLGSNPEGYSVSIRGYYGCDNPSDKQPPAWQSLEINDIPLDCDDSGNCTFSANVFNYVSKDCPNPKWEMVWNLTAYIDELNISAPVSTKCRK